jgi:Beta propeller domain
MNHPTLSARRHLNAALLGAALLTLAACGGGGGDTTPPPSAANAGLAVSQPGELTRYVQQRLQTLNAQGRLPSASTSGVGDAGLPPTAMGAAPGAAATARSTTLVQEDGVDEPDLIQSDGNHLYTVQPQVGAGPQVAVYSRDSDGRAVALKQVSLAADSANDISTQGMVLSADQRTLAVVSQHWTMAPPPTVCEGCPSITIAWMRSSINVQRVDVGNPSAAAAGERISIDGHLVDSRRIGDSLVVVTAHRPTLPLEFLPANASAGERDAAIARVTAADVLPRMRRNGGASEPLLADTDCYLQTANGSLDLQLTTITVFDLRSPTLARSSRCFVGGSEALYMSTSHLYVATTRWSYPSDVLSIIFPPDIRTDIHKFALSGGAVAYRGTGQVEGHLGWDPQKKSYRLSEHAGDLRVLTFTGSLGWVNARDTAVAASPARLTVLRERASDQTLQVVSTLPNATRPAAIGKPNEQVFAVRFVGDRGYVVTFQRTDPLYVLDLSNPADPRTVGEVEVAGFSDYLFPMANGLLLGVGRDADTSGRVLGVKVALFDVSNPAAPTQRASLTLGAAGSTSALDFTRHGMNYLVVGDVARVAMPVNLSSTDYAGWQAGLQKLEVNTASGTLVNKGLAGGRSSATTALWLERSLQIGEQLHYLSDGTVQTHAW